MVLLKLYEKRLNKHEPEPPKSAFGLNTMLGSRLLKRYHQLVNTPKLNHLEVGDLEEEENTSGRGPKNFERKNVGRSLEKYAKFAKERVQFNRIVSSRGSPNVLITILVINIKKIVGSRRTSEHTSLEEKEVMEIWMEPRGPFFIIFFLWGAKVSENHL